MASLPVWMGVLCDRSEESSNNTPPSPNLTLYQATPT